MAMFPESEVVKSGACTVAGSGNHGKSVVFFTSEWKALERFVRGEKPTPEGMPSVYKPWLFYKDKGYQVDVFIVGSFEGNADIEFEGCKIHLLARKKQPSGKAGRMWYYRTLVQDQILLTKAAMQLARTRAIDVVYSYRKDCVPAGWWVARKNGAVFVKRFFGTWLYDRWYVQRTVRSRLMCLIPFLYWIWPSDLLIVSEDGTGGSKIAELLGLNKKEYRVWLNGIDKRWKSVDPGRFLAIRKSLEVDGDDFVLMCLSRLERWKRQDRVIEAMPAILEEVPNAWLIIVGDGAAREELEALAGKLGVAGRTKFLGMVEHNRVRETIGIADVFLQTNDVSCLGNTLLEALVCGRAIVTLNVGDTGRVISDGKNGLLLNDFGPEEIAKAVIELAKSPTKRAALEQGAADFSENVLMSWDERLEKEVGLVEQVQLGKRT